MEKYYAIIVAGGTGSRMGGNLPKQFMMLGDKPIIVHTIERFLSLSFPVEIILVLPSAYREYWKDYCFENNITFPHTLVSGGITRFHSVKNALKYLPADVVVAVHDGVRPFVRKEFLEKMYRLGEEKGAVTPVLKPTDSLRRKCPENKEYSVPVVRDEYLLLQTPQVFHSKILINAYEQAYSPAFTDDVSVVQKRGNEILFTPGNRLNIKITNSEDMLLAQGIFSVF